MKLCCQENDFKQTEICTSNATIHGKSKCKKEDKGFQYFLKAN